MRLLLELLRRLHKKGINSVFWFAKLQFVKLHNLRAVSPLSHSRKRQKSSLVKLTEFADMNQWCVVNCAVLYNSGRIRSRSYPPSWKRACQPHLCHFFLVQQSKFSFKTFKFRYNLTTFLWNCPPKSLPKRPLIEEANENIQISQSVKSVHRADSKNHNQESPLEILKLHVSAGVKKS